MSRLRVATGLAGLLVLVGAVLTAVPSVAVSTGTLHVDVVDTSGAPQVGLISPVIVGTSFVYLDEGQSGVSSHDFVLPVGRYGLVSLTRWAGITCAGVTTCDGVGLTSVTIPGVVDVVAGETATYTITVTEPATLSGTPKVGAALSVGLSDSLARWSSRLDAAHRSPVKYQWLRDGVDISGGIEPQYDVAPTDAGHSLSVRLYYDGAGDQETTESTGDTPTTRVLGPLTVPKLASGTHLAIGRTPITTKQQTLVRVDVTSGDAVVPGKVVVTLGKRTRTLTLRNGRAVMRVAKLKKGTYVLRAAYQGTSVYRPSTSAKHKLVVKAAR